MINPNIDTALQKMNELQKEFFKVKSQIEKDDIYGTPEMYVNIGSTFWDGYKMMADAVAALAMNDIKSKACKY